MRNALLAEWTKLRTTPGPAWLLLATVALGGAGFPGFPFIGVYLAQAPIAVLAVLVVSGEYSTGLIGTTLTAIPRRPVVLAAKAVVLCVPVAVAATVNALVGLAFARRLSGVGVAGSVAYLVLVALLGLGVAVVIRDSAVAIGTVLGLLYLPPILTQTVVDPPLHRFLDAVSPTNTAFFVGPWSGVDVLAAWSAGALLAGALVLRFRDT